MTVEVSMGQGKVGNVQGVREGRKTGFAPGQGRESEPDVVLVVVMLESLVVFEN